MGRLDNFKIIIPMTGHGSRFAAQGFQKLKPFIEVHNKPIIEWVVNMFPGDKDKIIFICRESHLLQYGYIQDEIKRIAPKATIFSIDDWKKKGPVVDVLKASHLIDDNCPVLVSYCDYYMHWDYKKFKKQVIDLNCDGSIPCYSNFHPHLLAKENLYASCRVNDSNNLLERKEKYSWNEDKQDDLNSPGLYFFKSKQLLEKYCNQLIDANDSINDEYYMSLPFNYMVQDGLTVWCPTNVTKFCQWGTPEDLAEHLSWIDYAGKDEGTNCK